MNDFDLIIFDCDGVLVDSEIIAVQVESRLLSDAGYHISPEEMSERFAGMNWKDALMVIEKEIDIPLSASLIDKSKAVLDAKLASDVEMVPGVKDALAKMTLPRCICSNSGQDRLNMMLTKVGLKAFFEPHIFSAMDLGPDKAKPKPDIFLHGAKQMGVAPERCVVIEDSTHGVHGARAAGMRVIGFTGGLHTYLTHGDRLTDAGAEVVISRMSDLPAMIKALSEWNERV